MLCSSLAFYLLLYSVRLLVHLYIFTHFLTIILFQSQVLKTSLFLLLLSGFLYRQFCLILCLLSLSAPHSFTNKFDSYRSVLKLLQWDDIIRSLNVIIRLSSHYQQTPCYNMNILTSAQCPANYQSIVTLTADSSSLSDIETLLTDSKSLSEYRHIIIIISIFIIITVQWSFCIYTIIFFYSSQYTLYPLFSPPTCTSSSLLTSACHYLVFPVINMFLYFDLFRPVVQCQHQRTIVNIGVEFPATLNGFHGNPSVQN